VRSEKTREEAQRTGKNTGMVPCREDRIWQLKNDDLVMASHEISPYTVQGKVRRCTLRGSMGTATIPNARSESLDCIVNRLLQIERLGKPDQFR